MESAERADLIYEFAEFRLDTRRHLLLGARDGQTVPLTTKAYELLVHLVRHRDQVVEKSALMQAVWPSVVVEENNLNQVITALRRVFGERRGEHRFIVTVPGRGYRFVADVHVQTPTGVPTASAPAHAGSSGKLTSIAVLPFANLTGEPDKEYFGDGMAEELIHMLTRVPGLRVPARTSSFAYKGKTVHIRDIARDLNVQAVIEGSVRSAGERIRVTAQLIDAQSGYHVWSQSFDRKFADIFALQDELASAIVGAIDGGPRDGEPRAIASSPPTRDLQAYQLFLQATALLGRLTHENYLRAVELLKQAIARDPRFSRAICAEASAHAGLAAEFGTGSLDEALTKCEERATQALVLDPSLSDAHVLLGLVAAQRLQWLASVAHFRRARSLPGNAALQISRSFSAWVPLGYLERALEDAMKSLELSPAEPQAALVASMLCAFRGDDAEALRLADLAEVLGWAKVQVPLPMIRSQIAGRAGRFSEAGELMKQGFPEPARRGGMDQLVDAVYAGLGDPTLRPRALGAIRGFFEARSAKVVATTSLPMLLMQWVTSLGDLDLAYRIGDAALDHFARGPAVPVASFVPQLWLPEMRPFRGDARFHAFAGGRLRMLEFWEEHGAPDGYELRSGRLHG
ncbi:MAG: winged helix-turn-helix domain-containing tetratricopeptide repeat protein [Gammaproteobacteria bacterium]